MGPELPGLGTLAPFWPDRLADLWPDRVAVVDPDNGERYTYPELRRRAVAMARGLSELGIRRGDRVAVLAHNGVPLLDLLFACGRLGAILVPINWRLNRREIRQLVDDTEPALLVAGSEFVELGQAAAPGIRLVELDDGLLHGDTDLREDSWSPAVRMEDPWLILFTGGTTGTPKGAVLTHGSITWNAINTAVSWGLSEQDVGPSFTPMFHTGGWNVFTLPLLMLGGRVILPARFDPGEALRAVEEERATVLFMVPTMFQQVAEQAEFASAGFSSLRWAISGGAPLPPPVYEIWRPKVRLFKQGYGLTEVGPNNFATPDQDVQRKQGSVGRLTYFARARVVDDTGRDVPDGTPGELLLAGPHMCAGYWRRPEATAEAIRDGWFYTGDIARRDGEGYFYIVDRKKDLIITGGENVYPTEVEAVLYEHPAVREAAVVGIPDETWGEAIWAAIAPKGGHTIEPAEMTVFTRRSLAGYKVPKQFVILDELPKSAAGKILRAEARRMVLEMRRSGTVDD